MAGGSSGINGLFSEDTKLTIAALHGIVEALKELKDVLEEIKAESQESKELLKEIRDSFSNTPP